MRTLALIMMPIVGALAFCVFAAAGESQPDAKRRSPAAFEINCTEPGALTAANQHNRGVFTIRGGRGIGEAVIRLSAGTWPEEIILRIYLGGLESLKISAGKLTLAASVLSHGGNGVLRRLDRDGKEGPELDLNSPYWMEIRIYDADGKRVAGAPPKGGWFEMAVPNALLKGVGELKVSWIDFYR
jgi:hypothetical protein